VRRASRDAVSRRTLSHETWLGLLLAAIVLVFSAAGTNFGSWQNAIEIVRLSGEVGLLALALTPIIIAGGIDLSVGSLMGLVAVVFGLAWRDGGMPPWLAAAAALATATAGGALNAVLIARFGLPPLLVTLGTLSLFRGLAEGITGGADFVSGFPRSFTWIGQSVAYGVPPQFLALAATAVVFAHLLHRTIHGRSWYAIGHSPEGARYAGIPVARHLAALYVLSGIVAGCAALLYVARIGQAKADAGTGYELMAIAAVVLGGTAITGGRGTIGGTLLGVAGIVILQNGLRLADLPAELAGILIGALLLAAISGSAFAQGGVRKRAGEGSGLHSPYGTMGREVTESHAMRTSQLVTLCAAVLAGALIVAGSNWWMVGSLERMHHDGAPAAQRARSPDASAKGPDTSRPVTVAMMPKAKGDPYFVSCRKGAEEGARQVGATLIWDGPTDLDPARQNEVVESWITRGVDVIAVSVENKASISTALRKARSRGIKVIAWDADAEPDARDFLINQATPQGIGETLADRAAALLDNHGEFAIVTASLSAANQNEWMRYIRARLAEKYPGVRLVAVQPSDGDRDRAFSETQTILKVHPRVKVIMGIAAPAVPGAAEAVRQSGRTDVRVIGLSLPNMCKPYVKAGVIDSIVLWNTRDLGYLTVIAADALAKGTLAPGRTSIEAGRLGKVEVKGDQVLLGKPFIFTRDNIDGFDF
jgi:rhamnose transport system substrate-binding protein